MKAYFPASIAPGWLAPALAVALLAGWASRALADDSVDEAREAFQSSATFPWYDGTKDSLTPLELQVEQPPKNVDLAWLKPLAWAVLGATLLLLVVLIVYSIRHFRGASLPNISTDPEVHVETEGVEALPFMARRSRDDLLGQARHHYEQGNYNEAIVYLFSYELVQLDKFAVIHLARGKTNRQYVRETAKAAELQGVLRQTMLTFEDVFFGGRQLDRAAFEACWQHVEAFANPTLQAVS